MLGNIAVAVLVVFASYKAVCRIAGVRKPLPVLPWDYYERPWGIRPNMGVLVLLALGFLLLIVYLSTKHEIFSKVSPIVTSELNDPLNRALGTQLLPPSQAANPRYAPPPFSPRSIRSAGAGWQEYVIEARQGWCELGIEAKLGDRIAWMVTDSTYGNYDSDRRVIPFSVFGYFKNGEWLTPALMARGNPRRYWNFPSRCLRAEERVGVLLLRRGDGVPRAISGTSGAWELANPAGWLGFPNPSEPVSVALNLPQWPREKNLTGTYSIRLIRIPEDR
jgi:hypothetical protein